MLRLATPSDYPAMHRVRLAVRENALAKPGRITEAEYIDAMGRLGQSWVVEHDGNIVAFASGLNTGNVWALFVHPNFEARGYGKLLHATLVAWLRALEVQPIWLTTGPGTRAERFYTLMGWKNCGLVEGEVRFELDAAKLPENGVSRVAPAG